MTDTLIGSQAITTTAGTYRLEFHNEEFPESPFDCRSIFSTGVLLATRRYFEVSVTGEESAKDHGGPGVDTIQGAIEAGHSPRAILRWLRVCRGAAGFVELTRNLHDGSVCASPIDEASASTSLGTNSAGYKGDPQLEGLACIFPADYAGAMGEDDVDPAKALDIVLSEWHEYGAYSVGEVIGYVLKDPDGEEVGSCWGYYGDTADNRAQIVDEATSEADYDSNRRVESWLRAEREAVDAWLTAERAHLARVAELHNLLEVLDYAEQGEARDFDECAEDERDGHVYPKITAARAFVSDLLENGAL